jgi:uncharacterized protein (DUF2252 family)
VNADRARALRRRARGAPPATLPLAARRAMGKAVRDRLPRKELARWKVDARRPDLVQRLLAAVSGRRADLLPIRWEKMAASPFAFLRGTAALMAGDVGPMARTGLAVQVCGDAHLLNLGAYAAPDGRLVFDLNDFDETCRGPFEWDLKRLAASFTVAGRVAGNSGPSCASVVHALAAAFGEGLERFAEMEVLDLARLEIGPRRAGKPLAPIFTKARRNTPAELLARATRPAAGGYARFRREPPILVPLAAGARRRAFGALGPYRATVGPGRQQLLDAYAPHDAAFKVVGTGSVGLEVYLVLLYGNGPRDPLFLQLKEQDATCWRPYLRGGPYRRLHPHDGRRAAEGQLRTQTVGDPFIGWTDLGGKDFLVRQWSDHKASVSVDLLASGAFPDYAALCGEVLAKAHARTGDAGALSGYCGRGGVLGESIAAFAAAYADQVEADYARFMKALKRGELQTR